MNIPEAPFSDDVFVVADAMTERDMKNDDVLDRIKAKVKGIEYTFDPSERSQRFTARTAFNLLRIENPDGAAKADERISSFGDTALKELAEERGLTFERTKQIIDWFVNRLTSLGVDDPEQIADGFRRESAVAKALAAERNITVADVYLEDEHYYELLRRTWTAEESANDLAETIDSYTTGFSHLAILLTMEEILSKNEVDREDLLREVITHELPEEHMQAIHLGLEPFFESRRQFFMYDFVKTYGQDAFFTLDEKIRHKVLPRTEWADDLFEA